MVKSSNKIEYHMKKEGRTRSWLAEKCGIKTATLGFYMRGDRVPSKAVLILMAQALNCHIEDLLEKHVRETA